MHTSIEFSDEVGEVFPEQLHATACSLFETNDPDEHRAETKGFSVRFGRPRGRILDIEFGILDDGLLTNAEECLRLQRDRLRVGRRTGDVRHAEVLEIATWEDLADDADHVEEITIDFETPTFFRRGRAYHLFPSPSVVFGHWRRRWEVFHSVAPQCEFDDRQVNVVAIDLRTHDLSYRGERLGGFTGSVTYDVSGLPDSDRAAMCAFALIGPYAGCGSRTTAGFGAVSVELV
ncbi:MAG: CRISPR system precrRNA processing endoribonuclease RAMP protein Cas6 [Nevskiaceae bacterium]